MSARGATRRLDPIEWLFLLAAALAPLDLRLAAGLTVHDVIIAGIGVLLLLDRRPMRSMPVVFLPAVFVFLLFALLSCFRAPHPLEAMTQTGQYAFIFFVQLPVVFTVVRTRRILNLSIAMIVLGSIAGILVALVTQQAGGAGRITTFYSDNANRLGYPTAYLLPFVLYYLGVLWRRGRTGRALLLGIALLYPMLWALTASASRSATVATVVGLVLYIVFLDGLKGSVRRAAAAALGLLTVFVLVFSTGLFPSTLQHRIQRSVSNEESEQIDLLDDRRELAKAANAAILDSPFIGTGLDNFRYVANRYEARATAQAPHNALLAMAAQVGVIGALAFLFIITTWFEILLRGRAVALDRTERRLVWAFIACMAAIVVIFMTTPIIIQRHYWLIFGLGLALVSHATTDPRVDQQGPLYPAADEGRPRSISLVTGSDDQ